MTQIKDLFDLIPGNGLELYKMKQINNGIPFVGRTSKNNGITGFVEVVKDVNLMPENTISVSCGGSVLESFFQPEKYYTSYHVYCLKPKLKMSNIELQAYAFLINKNNFRYNYNRQANRSLPFIEIPQKDNLPKWLLSEGKKYEYNFEPIIKNFNKNSKWDKFKIEDLFDISGSKTTKINYLKKKGFGEFPYITTKAENNGVDGFYDYYTEKGNVICVDSAVTGFCSYQSKNFSASDHVEILKPKKFDLNLSLGIFICTLLNQDNFRFNYGRKRSQERLKYEDLVLPVDQNKNINFSYIENFIKSLKFSRTINP